jgi:hypothetical protein
MAVPTLQEQIAAVAAAEAGLLPPASTGQVVKDDATAGIQNPPQATSANGRIVNVEQQNQQLLNSQYVASNGSSADTLTTTNSQATPPNSNVPIVQAANTNQDLTGTVNAPASASTQPGASAPRDDNTAPNTNTVQQIVNNKFQGAIIPQPNVLDNYASYTYAISWYLLTPTDYATLERTGQKNVSTWKLLMQSGGIPTAQRYSKDSNNQIFNLDYYLDNLEIESECNLYGTNFAHSAFALSFTVTEPNGITLIQNLYNAVNTMYKQLGNTDQVNYLLAQYCLAVRFYGYDENGNLVYPARGGLNGKINRTDKNAVIEKFYPFIMENLTFTSANRAVEYRVKGVPAPYQIGFGSSRGSVPFSFNLVGETVGELLNGSVAAPAAVDTAREATVTSQPKTAPVVTAPTVERITSVSEIQYDQMGNPI